ncbi:hypothetical protein [Treponema bryantii]|nr:hypothetical protein [Treponema bryantii]
MRKLHPLDIIFVVSVLGLGIFLTVKSVSHKGSVFSIKADGNRYEYS